MQFEYAGAKRSHKPIIMPIYCDEAGYTGYNLLEENQPYFVYAAIDIEENIATNFIDSMKAKYKLQGEPKGANWVKNGYGRKALIELFKNYSKNARIVFHHKKYALACKFYEYVFEPTISEYNHAFYRYQFHRFIANLVFVAFESNEKKAEDVFWTFQELLRGNNPNDLFSFLSSKNVPNDLASMLAEFTIIHKKSIFDEIMTDGKYDYWILDLAQTALQGLLCTWSMEKKEGLEVIVDESQPLKEAVANNKLFHQLNAELKYWDPFGSGETAMNFSLSKPIKFSRSKGEKGLQMADLFASTVYWALKNPKDDLSKAIEEYWKATIPKPNTLCISPEPEMYLHPSSMEFAFGVTALNRLLEFSRESPVGIGKRFLDHLIKGVAAHNKHALKKR
jgi:hypothetical protein